MLWRDSIFFPIWPDRPWSPYWDSDQMGFWGERAVARRLWQQGWGVRAHRWAGADGSDIDLVVANDDRLLFCEIKLRTDNDPDPWAALRQPERRARLAETIGAYLIATRQRQVSLSVNAYLVRPDQKGQPEIAALSNILEPAEIRAWRGIPDAIAAQSATQPATDPTPRAAPSQSDIPGA